MQAILLAGGFGTRLQPTIGSNIPKSMALISGTPFLAQYIAELAEQNIKEAMLAVHHHAEFIQDYFGDEYAGVTIRYSVEKTPLGTGGAMRQALQLLAPTQPVFVSNADSIMDIDITAMLALHQRKKAALTIAVKQVSPLNHSGCVMVGEDGRILKFTYPHSTDAGLISLGAYIINTDFYFPETLPEVFSFEQDFKAHFIGDISAYAYHHHGRFIDFGTETNYKIANRQVLEI